MRFVDLPPANALGGLLAHACRLEGRRVAKGTPLDAELIVRLEADGVTLVTVALPDADDVHEDEAARRLAEAFAGEGIRVGRAATGRANLYAERAGLFLFDRDVVLAINGVDEGVTLATLGENLVVPSGLLLATVKIIPFAVPGAHLRRAVEATRPARVAASRPRRAALLQTMLPHLSARALDKTRRVTEARLDARGVSLVAEGRCEHRVDALADALADASRAAAERDVDWLLVVGASAIADRRDVIPAAIERSGGTIERFGLPVDPGNLMLIARLGERHVLGLPGCARSPRTNGLDRILDRLAHDVPLERAWLDGLAVGGLLEEIVERGAPRRGAHGGSGVDEDGEEAGGEAANDVTSGSTRGPESGTSIALLVLAAGASTRMGADNKLLLPAPDRPGESMVRRVAASACRVATSRGLARPIVVTGHQPRAVAAELDALDVATVHNRGAARGMASSLVCGVSAALERARTDDADGAAVDAVLVCLGDMPRVRSATLEALVDARRARPDRSLFVPTAAGRRGNPVLIGREWFDTLLALQGDVGAKRLLADNPEAVLEVAVDDEGVLIDHDRPEDLLPR